MGREGFPNKGVDNMEFSQRSNDTKAIIQWNFFSFVQIQNLNTYNGCDIDISRRCL